MWGRNGFDVVKEGNNPIRTEQYRYSARLNVIADDYAYAEAAQLTPRQGCVPIRSSPAMPRLEKERHLEVEDLMSEPRGDTDPIYDTLG